ncbi:MAG: patatin-like phospholipase family protein [Clostridiaceae bacterium]|nr:patatin-like phospholipase family protein [Clostridiaceae bacterium]
MAGLGLALGGGGSKGIYQLGAWKAFREIGLAFDAIAGTSIGSINGAFMAVDDYEGACRMWQNLSIGQCLAFAAPQNLKSNDLLSLGNAGVLVKELFVHHALDTQPMRDMISFYIKEEKLRSSMIRYGLMTAVLPDLSPRPLWIQDIPQNQLIDYIMASARLPGLEPVKIDGQRYIDGGVAENVPLSMLKKQGFRHIVAIDLSAARPGVHSPFLDNIQLTYIHNHLDLGKTLDLTPEILEKNHTLGYLDASKAFGRLSGDYYAFENDDYAQLAKRFDPDMLAGLEQAALAYDLKRTVIYRAQDFVDLILKRRHEVQADYEARRQSMHIDKKIKAIISGQLKVLNLLPSIRLSLLIELYAKAKQNRSFLAVPLRYFPNLELAARVLMAMDQNCE